MLQQPQRCLLPFPLSLPLYPLNLYPHPPPFRRQPPRNRPFRRPPPFRRQPPRNRPFRRLPPFRRQPSRNRPFRRPPPFHRQPSPEPAFPPAAFRPGPDRSLYGMLLRFNVIFTRVASESLREAAMEPGSSPGAKLSVSSHPVIKKTHQ